MMLYELILCSSSNNPFKELLLSHQLPICLSLLSSNSLTSNCSVISLISDLYAPLSRFEPPQQA